MTAHFKRIGILGEAKNRGTLETLQALLHHLMPCNYSLIIEQELAAASPYLDLPQANHEHIVNHSSLVIVIGGDGSLLRAARFCHENGPPLLGINRGRLGFLTDLYPSELESTLIEILNGYYHEERRARLCAEIETATEDRAALNDVVITTDSAVKMLEFEIYINQQFVSSQRADGLIVATPTGSTAYALSANGPILHPGLSAITLVPMCPHTLSSRPLVIADNHTIDIVVKHEACLTVGFSCDGQALVPLGHDTRVRVSKHQHDLRLIHPMSYDYFETLRSKLQWGTKLAGNQP